MKKIRNLVLLFAMIMVLGGVNVYAANVAVGDQLLQPEAGWQRYDDSHIPFSSYQGNWVIGEIFEDGDIWDRDDYWGSTLTHVQSKGTIKFIFSGDKLRLITKLHNSRSQINTIIIDGQEEKFSEYSVVEDNSLNLSVVYEKMNLSKGYHICEISMDSPQKYLTIDAIDIDENGKFLYLKDPNNLESYINNGRVKLKWEAVDGTDSYTILRSTTSDSIETIIASNVTDTTYIDNDVEPGVTYYYVVRAVKGGVESEHSNITSAMIEKVNPAVLQIKLSTTDIYEYRITMNEVKDFIKWYTDRSNESGLPFYKFKTVDSNIEPYTNSNEYLIFDKIVWFKIKEYTK
ncbi:MAG: fibronectin type III domain-containing protein [Vallitalea sp.]|nr:fibronectin type III domain-containing protein [Vallitalea sp.]